MTITRVRATAEVPGALDVGEAFVRADGVAVVRAGVGGVELEGGRLDLDDGERTLDRRALADLVRACAH